MGLGASCEIETNYVAHLASIKESGIGATCWGAHAAVVVYRCQCCCKIPVKIHIIIMEICKASTLRLKALNKHSMTRIMYIEMENVIPKKKKKRKMCISTSVQA